MSRRISKILVICAMIAIFPLMIVGTAFAAYNSIESVVNVASYVDFVSSANGTYASVMFNGEAKNEIVIKKGHTQNVEVKAHYSNNAYTFKGWYVGDKAEYEYALSNGEVQLKSGESLKFKMEDAKNYLAVYEINKFDVTYSYTSEPNGSDTVTEAPEGKSQFKYGEVLPVLTTSNNDYKYAGWMVNGARYQTATFAKSETYQLTEPWLAKTKVGLTFQVQGVNIETVSVNEEEIFVLPSVESIVDKINTEGFGGIEGFNKDTFMKDGHSYTWSINDNSYSQVSPTADMTFTVKESLVEYKAQIKNANEWLNESAQNEILFTKENTGAVSDLFNLAKHKFYEINSIKFETKEYVKDNIQNFVTDVIAKSKYETITVEIEIVGESKCNNLTAKNITFKAGSGIVFDGKVHQVIGGVNQDLNDFDSLTGDLTDTVYELLNINGITLYNENNEVVKLKQLWINDSFGVKVSEDTTLAELIDIIIERKGNGDYTDTTFTISSLEADFVVA